LGWGISIRKLHSKWGHRRGQTLVHSSSGWD
jgi:hypothetical protein